MRACLHLTRQLIAKAPLIASLARQHVRTRYVKTVGGFGWAIVQPLVMVATLWFVFTFGFKAQTSVPGLSYSAFFLVGMAAWLLIAESLNSAVGSVSGASHLVKKMVFPLEILPAPPIAAAVLLNLCVLGLVLAVVAIDRGLPWTAVLLPYHVGTALALVAGLAWLTSALNVLFPDMQKLVETLLSVWFWLTPVVWPLALMDGPYLWLLRLNPAVYVVEGYRDCLLSGIPFWQRPVEMALFWTFALLAYVCGSWTFERLKSQFSEMM